MISMVSMEQAGAKLLVLEDGEVHVDGPVELAASAPRLIRDSRNVLLDHGGQRVFAEVYGPPPRLFLYGAVDMAEALCRAARLLGWTTIVADARSVFATRARIPSADELIVAWPQEAIDRAAPDHQTAVVVLTHEDRFDTPALRAALDTDARYIGALGSRHRHEQRRVRLLEAGVPESELGRILGPSGPDIGAESTAETAFSIIAEILAVRAGRPGGHLRLAAGPIHARA
jgi:xanthine dehydrogenase accessory factor